MIKTAFTAPNTPTVIASDFNGTLEDSGWVENAILFLATQHRNNSTVGIFTLKPGQTNEMQMKMYAMKKLPELLAKNNFSPDDITSFIDNIWLKKSEISGDIPHHKADREETEGFENGVHFVLEDEMANWVNPDALQINPRDMRGQEFLEKAIKNPESNLFELYHSIYKPEPGIEPTNAS